MTRYADLVSARKTPQTERVHDKQVKNSAGGYSFKLDKWGRLQRFLILGAEGGTYYINERKLVKENFASLQECLADDGLRAVKEIVDISVGGRAPSNEAAIFALAVASAHGDAGVRSAALEALPQVCRIGTHLFDFLNSLKEFRGMGRGVRKAVAAWYLEKDPHRLGLQVAKYRQRNGWSHRDVLRKLGGEMGDAEPSKAVILRWVVGGMEGLDARHVNRNEVKSDYDGHAADALPKIIVGYEKCKSASNAREAAQIVREYRLTHEMVPSERLESSEVWDALMESMPIGALVRNLGRITSLGCLGKFSDAQKSTIAKLTDPVAIKKARLHPLQALKALKAYNDGGKSGKGSLKWTPEAKISDALEDAFYLGFDAVEPTGLNTVGSLDMSGSMAARIAGMPNLSCAEASAAMLMVTARCEENHEIQGFSDGLTPVNISKRERMDSVMNKTAGKTWGGTDCALPIVWATQGKIPVDVFHVYTDSETYYGSIHPHTALEQYRQKMGRDAKLVVVGMTSNGFSIANPDDAGMLDVVGFNTAVPALMADFARQGFGG